MPLNELGLHARPAREFVRAANTFRSKIWLITNEERFSATSIIEVLKANLDCGDTTTAESKGTRCKRARGFAGQAGKRIQGEGFGERVRDIVPTEG